MQQTFIKLAAHPQFFEKIATSMVFLFAMQVHADSILKSDQQTQKIPEDPSRFTCFDGLIDHKDEWDLLARNLILRKRGGVGVSLCSLYSQSGKRNLGLVAGFGEKGPEAYLAYNWRSETTTNNNIRWQSDIGHIGIEHASFGGSSLSGPDPLDTLSQEFNGLGAFSHLRIGSFFETRAFVTDDGTGLQTSYALDENWVLGGAIARIDHVTQADFYAGYTKSLIKNRFLNGYKIEAQATSRSDVDQSRWAVSSTINTKQLFENHNIVTSLSLAAGTGVLENQQTDLALKFQFALAKEFSWGPITVFLGPVFTIDTSGNYAANAQIRVSDVRHPAYLRR